jgi:hypothetical protein
MGHGAVSIYQRGEEIGTCSDDFSRSGDLLKGQTAAEPSMFTELAENDLSRHYKSLATLYSPKSPNPFRKFPCERSVRSKEIS